MIGAGLMGGAYEQDCHACPTRPQWQRERWGCDAESSTPCARIPFRGSTIEVRRCPMKTLPAETLTALQWIGLARLGHWPCAGGTLDQCASFVDAFNIASAELSRLEAEASKRA